MRQLTALALALAFTLGFAAPGRAADTPGTVNHDADVAAIRQVVQRFQAAIVAHDGKTLASLFLQDHDSWLEVADDKTWADVKARHPEARKVLHSSWRKFTDDVQADPKPIEERFHDVRIETNGAVASVYFDFDFLADGKLNNRGSETWQLVRAEDGWKISAMLYSIGR